MSKDAKNFLAPKDSKDSQIKDRKMTQAIIED